MLRLLVVTAHPDDEAGAFGGSLLLYHERGVETYVVCLTPGQAASNRGEAKSPDQLISMRREEFARSCEILQVTRGEVLDFPDGALDHANFYSLVERVTRSVREIRPQVMLTFGTEGGITAHPDHSMAALIATAAFHWAGRSNRFVEQLNSGLAPHRVQKLYYTTSAMPFPDREPVALAPSSAAIDVSKYLDTKLAAFKAHTTQNPLYERFNGRMRQLGTEELFLLAATREPQKLRQETDLFEGVTDE
ncbi:MAG TPA: PIG-L family deacetylase [Terriglobales bacterium]